jgi:hypothetical protein
MEPATAREGAASRHRGQSLGHKRGTNGQTPNQTEHVGNNREERFAWSEPVLRASLQVDAARSLNPANSPVPASLVGTRLAVSHVSSGGRDERSTRTPPAHIDVPRRAVGRTVPAFPILSFTLYRVESSPLSSVAGAVSAAP